MDSRFFRKYIDIINENANEVVSQTELMTLYQEKSPKPSAFVKVAVEAVIPRTSELAKKLEASGMKGKIDSATYNEQQPYMVIQGKKGGDLDVYTNTAETLRTKLPKAEPDKLLTDALINYGITLQDIEKAGGGFYKKPADAKVFMIPAKDLGVENKTIDAGWGTQQVLLGGFLVLEKYPNVTNIYAVNPDSDGLPIAYVPAQK